MQTRKLLELIGATNVATREQREATDTRIAALERDRNALAEQVRELRELVEAMVYNAHEAAKQ